MKNPDRQVFGTQNGNCSVSDENVQITLALKDIIPQWKIGLIVGCSQQMVSRYQTGKNRYK